MAIVLWILGLLAALHVLLVVAARVMARRWASGSRADEVRHARTGDGWLVALHRYRPREPVAGREPVIVCHGLLSNRASMDLDDRVSLAVALRDAGLDTWVMELRARGASRRDPGAPRRFPWFDWTIDDFVREDLPAAVRGVREATGARQVLWVGHSLGGMILYAHCAEADPSWCRAAVAIDAPGHFAPLRRVTWPAIVWARLVPFVPVIVFKPIFGLLYAVVPERLLGRHIRLDRPTLLKVLHNGLVDVGSSRILRQLAECLAEGRFRSFDGSVDWERGPERITFPLMVLRAPAGRAPEACVKRAYDLAPSAEKAYVVCGRDHGFAIDHNHFSLVIGETAPREIFPRIAGWLRRHASA